MTLSEYLTEGILSKDAGVYSRFPEKPDKKKMIIFLESKGFKEMSNSKIIGKTYWVGECNPNSIHTFWIKFTDGERKDSEKLVFFYRFKNLGYREYPDLLVGRHEVTPEEFKDKAYEYFGWE